MRPSTRRNHQGALISVIRHRGGSAAMGALQNKSIFFRATDKTVSVFVYNKVHPPGGSSLYKVGILFLFFSSVVFVKKRTEKRGYSRSSKKPPRNSSNNHKYKYLVHPTPPITIHTTTTTQTHCVNNTHKPHTKKHTVHKKRHTHSLPLLPPPRAGLLHPLSPRYSRGQCINLLSQSPKG